MSEVNPVRNGEVIHKALGVNPQALIAEGINHVLAKYRKPTVAT